MLASDRNRPIPVYRGSCASRLIIGLVGFSCAVTGCTSGYLDTPAGDAGGDGEPVDPCNVECRPRALLTRLGC